MIPASQVARLQNALPFWMSIALVPLAAIATTYGGWTLLLMPLYALVLTSIVDAITSLNTENADLETPDDTLFWYRLVTLIWFPLQFFTVFALIWWVTHASHLATWEIVALFYGIGMMSGGIGINYAHELIHQKNNFERWLGDLLMGSVLYSHFRSEHLLVHHRYVATPRDPVTARYNEGFHRFFPRVLKQCFHSAWGAETSRLHRKSLSSFHRSNPFWRYAAIQAAMLVLAVILGGWFGAILFVFQAAVAIWFLELTNYVEHYGLTRRHLGDGKYEHVLPRHSWNASHRASNWLLINLQRHSDHHYKPNRRFPLLQAYDQDEAPQLPYGYPMMTAMAMIPPLWRRIMNPRVRAWRKQYYPDISDWQPYKQASNPVPR